MVKEISKGIGVEWHQTASLVALRELLARGARLRHVVARRAGLSDHELVVLDHLSREPLGPAEMARRLDVTTAAATGIVDRLVARGHVVRRPHPVDRRRLEVHPTDSGRAEVVGHLRPMFVALARLDGQFTEEERAVVARYLQGALAALDEVIEGDPEPPPGAPGTDAP
jgi:DNA-binding MarR family transcriptional regulator